jgi:hypothetical protein
MKNVNDSTEFVNVTIEEILEWAEEMGRKGLYDPSLSRHLRTALKALVSIMDSGEARDAKSVLANLDSLAERWARANRANPSTMKTYKQRATSLLEDYILYMDNPASFKGRGGGSGVKKPEKREERRGSGARAVPQGESDESARDSNALNTFRLPNGKVLRYSLPEGFTTEDLRRVVYHLLPATVDFDPMRPGGGFPPMSSTLESASVQ